MSEQSCLLRLHPSHKQFLKSQIAFTVMHLLAPCWQKPCCYFLTSKCLNPSCCQQRESRHLHHFNFKQNPQCSGLIVRTITQRWHSAVAMQQIICIRSIHIHDDAYKKIQLSIICPLKHFSLNQHLEMLLFFPLMFSYKMPLCPIMHCQLLLKGGTTFAKMVWSQICQIITTALA